MSEALKPELSEPASLAGLVAYQPGGVVSRALIQKPAGSVTLFAFAQGQALSEHTAPFDAIATVLEGEGMLMVEKAWHSMKAGESLLFPQGKIHAVRAEHPFKMLLIMIKG